MSDAEIITTAIIAAMYFGGNHSQTCSYMKDHKLMPRMLEKSRFNRRLHHLAMLMNNLFHQVGMATKTGIPVEFVFMPASATDIRGLSALPLNLLPGSQVYADCAYLDYTVEDDLIETSQISMQVMRKSNSKRQDAPWTHYIKQSIRHYIETVFSGITTRFHKSIHAVTYEGFLLKLQAFIFAYTLQRAFID